MAENSARAGARVVALAAALLPVISVCAATPARWAERIEPTFRVVATQTNRDTGLPFTMSPIAMVQDAAGFIWIGTTAGLERWDGYNIRTYKTKRGDSCALPAGFIVALHVDDRKQLWIGTLGGGLARYDPTTDCFHAVRGGADALERATVDSIVSDGTGGVLVGTRAGLVQVAADLVRVTRVAIDTGAQGDWSGSRVARVLRDRHDTLWVGTDNGLARREAAARTFVAVPLSPGVKVRELFESADGRIWVGTVGNGVYVINPATLEVRAVDDILLRKHIPLIWKAVQAPNGEIWLATPNAGIIVVDPVSLRTRDLEPRIHGKPALDQEVGGLLLDRRGLLWACDSTLFGFFNTDEAIATVVIDDGSTHQRDATVVAMARMGDDRIAMALNSQIALVAPHGRSIEGISFEPLPPPASISSIATLNGRDLFAAVQPIGLVWIDRTARRAHAIPLPGPGLSRHIIGLLADGERLWVAALEGVWVIEPGKTPDAAIPWTVARRFDAKNANAIVDGSKHVPWIGAIAGLYRANLALGELTAVQLIDEAGEPFEPSVVSVLAVDRRGRLWMGTNDEGVYVLDVTGQPENRARVLRYFASELPGGFVGQLLEDDAGSIWVATDGGLCKINEDSWVLRVVGRGDGVSISSYSVGAGLRISADELLFGGDGGLTLVNPKRPERQRPPPPVVITRISVEHRDVLSSRYNVDGNADVLEMPAGAASLMVEFAALDFSAAEQNAYAYRLEGYDRDWVRTGAADRMAMYTNLSPGTYHLHVRGTDHAGVWSPLERQLTVRVAAAWYQTMAFHAAEAIACLAIVVLIVQSRTVLLRARQRELLSLVEERTTALVRATTERNSLIENLAHDLRTPLTSLRGYLEQLSPSDRSLTEEDRGRFIGIATRQTERLIRLVHELFELVRLDDPLARLNLERFGPAEIVQDVVQEFASIADGRRIECDIERGVESVQILGDISLFQRLIDNLVVNAVNHTPAGGAISVRLGTDADGIVLEVNDTGRGIEPGDLERIFNRYQRGDSTGRIYGAGLGLAIVKRILELHRGSISVDSNLGRGTRFTVRLPWSGPASPEAAG